MNYVRGAISVVSNYYTTINPSTLTGAIDVIVVERPGEDGSNELVCTPFHVRFGKWQAFRPTDRQVTVLVNGQPIPYAMKIGEAGEAFFVFETEEDVPQELMTSPILGAQPDPEARRQHESAGRFGAPRSDNGSTSDVEELSPDALGKMTEPTFLDLDNSGDQPPSPGPSTPPISLKDGDLSGPPADASNSSASAQPGILSRTATATATALSAAPDMASVAKNAVLNAPNVAVDQMKKLHDRVRSLDNLRSIVQDDTDPGDAALKDFDKNAVQAPDVRYGKDIVLDMGGYHGPVQEEDDDGPHGARDNERHIRFSEKTPRATKLTFHTDGALDEDDAEDQYPRPLDMDRTPRPSFVLPPSPETSPKRAPELRRTISSPGPSTGHDLANDSLHESLSPTRLGTSMSSATIKALATASSSPPSPTSLLPKNQYDGYVRGESAPPELEGAPSESRPTLPNLSVTTPEYSWEWGAFPTRSPVVAKRAFLDEDNESSTHLKRPRGQSGLHRAATSLDDIDVEAQKHVLESSNGIKPQHKTLVTGSRSDGNLTSPERSPTLDPTTKLDKTRPIDKRASGSTWTRWWMRSRADQTSGDSVQTVTNGDSRPELKATSSAPSEMEKVVTPIDTSTPAPAAIPLPLSPTVTATPSTRTRYAKTLRLTSDQLKALSLKKGPNTITFSLSATGVTACTAKLFLWDSTDSVVISDIDGTITKSDALGHMFNLIGRDWTHLGVAKLYTDIAKNGYKVMYLTSRAIGQADTTRDYLKGIKQNNYQLPEGPVIMSPDRLMASFHREVIMRKPEVFKMACLRDIQRLFGSNKHPFYAGFGNRITDALSYRSVNVPSSRIFTIDSAGEVKLELLELAGYKSSYIHMTDLVDQMFPPIHRKWATEYTDFNYWRDPMPEIELPDLEPPSPALSAVSDASAVGRLARLRVFSLRSGSSNTAAGTAADAVTIANRRQTSPLGPKRPGSQDRHSATLVDSSSDREIELRRKLSFESLPGSMPGTASDYGDDDDEEEADEEADHDEEEGEDEEDEEGDEEEEVVEQEQTEFDIDILATGEMERVPFL
ncbi:hypothetical protein FRB93_007492 [Tulasnella sp. JGI-2019a]|nr:hypothetical protein FRB93_007492 [Tulasnella sp. JGI-2019a]